METTCANIHFMPQFKRIQNRCNFENFAWSCKSSADLIRNSWFIYSTTVAISVVTAVALCEPPSFSTTKYPVLFIGLTVESTAVTTEENKIIHYSNNISPDITTFVYTNLSLLCEYIFM